MKKRGKSNKKAVIIPSAERTNIAEDRITPVSPSSRRTSPLVDIDISRATTVTRNAVNINEIGN